MAPDPSRVYGVLSLVFWALMIIVIAQVHRARDARRQRRRGRHHGADRARACGRAMRSPGGKLGLVALGIFGASLFYGDGMITPAISVLSAVEGLEVATPSLGDYVVPIALVILTGAVRDPAPRHRRGRRAVRPGDGGVVLGAGRAGHRRDRRPPGHPALAVAELRRRVLRQRARRRVPRAGLGGARGDGRRGALRRHGPLRPSGHPPRVVRARAAGADAATTWARARSCCGSERRRQPVLPARPRRGAAARWSCSRRSPP